VTIADAVLAVNQRSTGTSPAVAERNRFDINFISF
jgi:hypothetical protein